MSSMHMRPKSSQWIVDQDDAIYREPVGTFRKAAASKWAPSSSFGTSTRFEPKQQAGQSHNLEACGPDLGPGYDVVSAFEATQPKAYTLKIHDTFNQKEYLESRPLRWQEGNQDRTEGTDINTYQTLSSPCFGRASKKNYHGQAKYARYTSIMGTGPRFSTTGGLAGTGNKSHFNSQAGDTVQVRDIRRWPESPRKVRRDVIELGGGSSSRLDFTFKSGEGRSPGEGSGVIYNARSCFDQAAKVGRNPSSSMGTQFHPSMFR